MADTSETSETSESSDALDTAVQTAVARARSAFARGLTRPLRARHRNLEALRRMIVDHRGLFEHALYEDLHKSRREAGITEIDTVLAEVAQLQHHLRRWTAPRRVRTPLVLFPASAHLVQEPLGVILVMSPWNYPVNLTLDPLAGVLAAGNAAVIKPSPESPSTSGLLAKLIPRYFPDGSVQVLLGDVEVAQRVLEERFDHIIFTGSGRVGRIVMTAAAKHLTPVTLELGGKSPVWFDDDAHIDAAARRLVWAKFTNAGQTCVSPDYVMTTPDRVPALVEALRRAIDSLWGEDPSTSPEYAHIISERHFDRLVGYLDGVATPEAAADDPDQPTIVAGGQHQRESLYIAPTVVTFPKVNGSATIGPEAGNDLLRDEIFGPILPIVPVASAHQAVRTINRWDKPLSLYVFSGSQATCRLFERETSSGAIVNSAGLIHVGTGTLPFGGVGASGMGAYHGRASIRTFSHWKPVLTKPLFPDTLRMLNPGTNRMLLDLLGRLQRHG